MRTLVYLVICYIRVIPYRTCGRQLIPPPTPVLCVTLLCGNVAHNYTVRTSAYPVLCVTLLCGNVAYNCRVRTSAYPVL